jgi:hypothetical protein
MSGAVPRVATGVAGVALGTALLFGAAAWPNGRVMAISIAVLMIVSGVVTLWSSILLVAAIWGVGWIVLVGGIAAPNAAVIVGGAVAVGGGVVALITNNYATWFAVAALGDAVALIAIAVWASGTGGALTGAATAGLAVASLALGGSLLVTPYRP